MEDLATISLQLINLHFQCQSGLRSKDGCLAVRWTLRVSSSSNPVLLDLAREGKPNTSPALCQSHGLSYALSRETPTHRPLVSSSASLCNHLTMPPVCTHIQSTHQQQMTGFTHAAVVTALANQAAVCAAGGRAQRLPCFQDSSELLSKLVLRPLCAAVVSRASHLRSS